MHINEASTHALGFDYQLKRSSRRRTLEVQIKNGAVFVRAPVQVGPREIQRFLSTRRDWINRKLAEQQQCLAEYPPREFTNNATWWWLGEAVSLVMLQGPVNQVALNGNTLCVQLNRRALNTTASTVPRLLETWYKEQAHAMLSQKALALASAMGLNFREVRIRKTKSRWGHCTSQGVLQFNWLIVQAPESVIDYLVAHEVSHLKHFNHSRAFWQMVASVCPDYQQQRQWLKQNGQGLWF